MCYLSFHHHSSIFSDFQFCVLLLALNVHTNIDLIHPPQLDYKLKKLQFDPDPGSWC